MGRVEPYDLKTAQELVEAEITRSKPRHEAWRALEILYRTGSLEQAQKATEAGKLGELLPDLDRQVVNLVLPHLNVMLASIVARDPKHLAEPVGGDHRAEDMARTAEGVVSYFWRRTQGTENLLDSTRDMLLLGNGFLKSGWLEERRQAEEGDLEWDVWQEERLELASMMDPEAEELDEDELGDPPDVILIDEPYLEYASPYDIFVPPNANRVETTPWIAHRVTLPMDEIKANDQFDQKVEVKPDGHRTGNTSDVEAEWKRQHKEDVGWEQNERAVQTATLWEFYDMRARRMLVFQLGSDEPLVDEPFPYDHRYPPFLHMVNYRQNGNTFWGFGDLENVARVQALFNEMVSLQMDNARRAGTKYLVHEDSWEDSLKSGLEDDTPEVVIPVKGVAGQPLDEIIKVVQREGLSGDVYAAKDELEDHVRKTLGINDFQAGGVGADRMSATAAAVVDGVASLRAQDKIAAVERMASHGGMHLLLLCQQFLEAPRVVRIVSPEGALWPEVSREDISGEYLITIEGGSTQAVNPQTREQKGMRTLGEILPLLEQFGMDPMPLLRSGLSDLGYDPDLVLKPLPQEPAPGPAGPAGPGGAPQPPSGGELPPELPADVGGPPEAALAQAAGDIAL